METESTFLYTDITKKIIKAFYHVYNELGYGFPEKVYENAMLIALREEGLSVTQQAPIDVYFRGQIVGEYRADLVVNDLIIVELKSVEQLNDQHEAQLLCYLKATRYEVGLLLNFGPKPERKRKAFSNNRKGSLAWIQTKTKS